MDATESETSHEAPSVQDVEHELARLLRRARRMSYRSASAIDPDLELSGYVLLLGVEEAVAGGPGCRATDLAETMGAHKSTISRGLSRLERLGLVERLPDPSDGRARVVRLTARADERILRLREARHAGVSAAMARWRREQVDELADGLRRLNDALD